VKKNKMATFNERTS